MARNAAPRSARGQILVIVAGGLIGLLAFAGLALEGGTLVLNRRDGQNSSDLAAVAGARMVALNYTEAGGKTQADVYGALTSNMAANGCVAPAPCTWTANFVGSGLSNLSSVSNSGAAIPGGSLGVRVQVTRTPGAMLGRMLGFTTWTVSTEGTAISTKVSSAASGIVLPIAMCGWTNPTSNDCIQATTSNGLDFQTGQLYDLTDGKDAPGGFGWLSWTGSNSAGALSDSVCTPNNPGFSIDSPYDSPGSPGTMGTSPSSGETWFPVDPGKSNKSSVRSCLDGWIARGRPSSFRSTTSSKRQAAGVGTTCGTTSPAWRPSCCRLATSQRSTTSRAISSSTSRSRATRPAERCRQMRVTPRSSSVS